MRNKIKCHKPGFSGIGFIIFIFVFVIIATLSIEYYRIFTIKQNIDDEISRGLNISVISALQDIDWINRDSVMDCDIAQAEFESYLIDTMGLNRYNQKYDSNGNFMYQIIIEDEILQESPAKYEVTGSIRMTPGIIENFMPEGYTFDIPFRLESQNVRTDE